MGTPITLASGHFVALWRWELGVWTFVQSMPLAMARRICSRKRWQKSGESLYAFEVQDEPNALSWRA